MSRAPTPPSARKNPTDARTQHERALAICSRLADGKASLRKAAKLEGLSHSSFLKMVIADQALRDLYVASREAGIEARVGDLSEIADRVMSYAKREGPHAASFVSAFGHKVRVEQWRAEKEASKKYGAKLELAGDPENPLAVSLGLRPQLSREEWIKQHGIS